MYFYKVLARNYVHKIFSKLTENIASRISHINPEQHNFRNHNYGF
jgi:hypothetical protein